MKIFRIVVLLLLISVVEFIRAEIIVDSISELQSAINSAQPGDEIVLKDGVYTLNSEVGISEVNGTADNWIIIRSGTVGGVEITGQKSFKIKNSYYIHVNGFRITQHVESNCFVIRSSEHIRVSNCSFDLQENGSKSYWLYVSDSPRPKYIRIDHNEFAAKYDEGCFIVVYGPSNDIARYVHIDHNHFKGHYFEGENGGEAIRFGDSNRQNYSSYSVIEDNLFENCEGDPEVISVKSSNFTVRRNTLLSCNGAITLRHGDSCLVEGNFILNGSGGIRFYGDHQKIIGNYIYNNNDIDPDGQVSTSRGALCIGAGVQEDLANGENTYDQPNNCIVAFNTLAYNVGANISIGVLGSDDYPPKNIIIANNIIVSDEQPCINILKIPENPHYISNLFFGDGGAGEIPDSGYRYINPEMSKDSYEVYHLDITSPAIDSAEVIPGIEDYIYDIDGQERNIYDIGADEYSQDSVKYRPLNIVDVGPQSEEIHCSSVEDVNDALINADPGDKIVIDPGTYLGSTATSGHSNAYFYTPVDGTPEKPIYLIGASSGNKPVLKGANIEHNYVLYITGDHWKVRDLIIQTGKKGIMLDNANHFEFMNSVVHTTGEEAIHLRDGSSFCSIVNCNIYNTGDLNPQYGEGIYVGSYDGDWDQYRKECNYNTISHCSVGPNVRAESVDIKEGTTGTIVEYCVFDGEGISGQNYADSFIDAKGNETIVRYNTAYRRDNSNITDAFQVHEHTTGWGFENIFIQNELYLDNTSSYVVKASSGSAIVSKNKRYPEGNMYYGNISEYDNIPPKVTITAPDSGKHYQAGESITIEAQAKDSDGRIARVDFYANDTKIGESYYTPYLYHWYSVAEGNYDLVAQAFDEGSVSSFSNTVTVIVDTLEGGIKRFSLTGFDVLASSNDGNIPQNTIDGSFDTRWSAEGDGEWIRYDLKSMSRISFTKIAFHQGDQRKFYFDLEVSEDGAVWKSIREAVESSGESTNLEMFEFNDVNGRYLRYVGHKNSENDWNSITEFEIWGTDDTLSTAIGAEDTFTSIPKSLEKYYNHPNPFNNQTEIMFGLPREGSVNLKIYDIRARLIKEINIQEGVAGLNRISINGDSWSSGIYFYNIYFQGEEQSGRMILIR